MVTDRIEKEVMVEAPVDAVWDVITRPDQISQWWADSADIDVRPGGEGTLVWDGRATNQATTVRISVESVERPRTFSFRWLHPEGAMAAEGNSVLIEFTLTPEGAATRVRVAEKGVALMGWPEAETARYLDQQSSGWDIHLAHLRDHVVPQQRQN
jgi:uncharacterized protein YndB with AHSA1/START domain